MSSLTTMFKDNSMAVIIKGLRRKTNSNFVNNANITARVVDGDKTTQLIPPENIPNVGPEGDYEGVIPKDDILDDKEFVYAHVVIDGGDDYFYTEVWEPHIVADRSA